MVPWSHDLAIPMWSRGGRLSAGPLVITCVRLAPGEDVLGIPGNVPRLRKENLIRVALQMAVVASEYSESPISVSGQGSRLLDQDKSWIPVAAESG